MKIVNVMLGTIALILLLGLNVASAQDTERILLYVTCPGDICPPSICGYTATTFDESLPAILEEIGFDVDILERGPEYAILTSELLANYDQLWVISSAEDYLVVFSDQEVQAVLEFREQGNGLYIAADNSGWGYYAATANMISEPLGVHYSGIINHTGGIVQACISPDLIVPAHPVLADVVELGQGRNDGSFTADAPVEIIASHIGYPLLATLDDGKGRCVFDVIITRAFDTYADYCDNKTLFQNIAKWLIGESGSIAGLVTTQNSGFPGVPVDLYDSESAILLSTITDQLGQYSFLGLNNGEYSVCISTPFGYQAVDETKQIAVEGLPREVNFELTQLEIPMAQRGRGYWMHQINALLSGKGNTHETFEDMCLYMELIRTHFNEHNLNAINVFEVVLNTDCNGNLNALRTTISLYSKASMIDKAKAHLTALLLNMVSGKIAQWAYISEDDATVSQAITYCNLLITNNDETDDEIAKDLAGMINEGQLIPAGWIDASTPDYSYRQIKELIPSQFSLDQNFPNPFNPTTEIAFSLPTTGEITLEIFNIAGQRVKILTSGEYIAGNHVIIWDGKNNQGTDVSSGIYFYRLSTAEFVDTKKMILLK